MPRAPPGEPQGGCAAADAATWRDAWGSRGPGAAYRAMSGGGSAADLGPGLDPVVEPLALDVRAPVEALHGRRRPVVHVLPIGGIVRVELGAVILVGSQVAGLGGAGRLAAVLRDLGVDRRGRDVVDEQVGANQTVRLGVDHPCVGPTGGAFGGVDRIDGDAPPPGGRGGGPAPGGG